MPGRTWKRARGTAPWALCGGWTRCGPLVAPLIARPFETAARCGGRTGGATTRSRTGCEPKMIFRRPTDDHGVGERTSAAASPPRAAGPSTRIPRTPPGRSRTTGSAPPARSPTPTATAGPTWSSARTVARGACTSSPAPPQGPPTTGAERIGAAAPGIGGAHTELGTYLLGRPGRRHSPRSRGGTLTRRRRPPGARPSASNAPRPDPRASPRTPPARRRDPRPDPGR